MEMPELLSSLSALKAACYVNDVAPRVHPNGFIQLDLDETRRLHVWHPALPYRQRTYHPVHSHVFDFTSHVYSGRLVNVEYRAERVFMSVAPDTAGLHSVAQAVCVDVGDGGQETMLRVQDDRVYRLNTMIAEALHPGQSYDFPAGALHETLTGVPTLTVMVKHGRTTHQGNPQSPSVMVPFGVEPDNDFRRDEVDVEVLWRLIGKAWPGA